MAMKSIRKGKGGEGGGASLTGEEKLVEADMGESGA